MGDAEERINELTKEISRLYHDNVSVGSAISLMVRRGSSATLVLNVYNQLSIDVDKLMMDRFYYYTIYSQCDLPYHTVDCWAGRYVLACYANSNSHIIKITDLFNDKSINLTVKKNGRYLNKIYPLKDRFGLLEERENSKSFISLICFDLYRPSLRKFHTVEYPSELIEIVVNKDDTTMFILNESNNNFSRICKIVNNTIIIGDAIEIGFNPDSFYDGNLYGLDRYKNDENIEIPRISIYNIEKKTKDQFDLEAPVGYYISWESVECVRGNLFLYLEHKNNTNVIGCLNVQTLQWNIVDFRLKLPIYSIDGFEEGNLIIHEQSRCKFHLYKIPFGNPDSLENTAWLSLIKVMKKRDTVEDPYEAARKYLPSTSTINCPF